MQNKIFNKTNFGMALYMPGYKKISRMFGKEIANEIELSRPALKKLAEDADIFVRPDKAWFEPENEKCWGMMMTANKVDNPFMARLRYLGRVFNLRSNKGYSYVPVFEMPNLPKVITQEAAKIKSEVL